MLKKDKDKEYIQLAKANETITKYRLAMRWLFFQSKTSSIDVKLTMIIIIKRIGFVVYLRSVTVPESAMESLSIVPMALDELGLA